MSSRTERLAEIGRIYGPDGVFKGPSALLKRLKEAYGEKAPRTHVAPTLWRKRGNIPPDHALQICALPEIHELGIKPRHICAQLAVPIPRQAPPNLEADAHE